MKTIPAKEPRFKLNDESYLALHRQILERDNWRCQSCGSMQNLQVHHIMYKSHSGGDIDTNLITLCAGCHYKCHGKRQGSNA